MKKVLQNQQLPKFKTGKFWTYKWYCQTFSWNSECHFQSVDGNAAIFAREFLEVHHFVSSDSKAGNWENLDLFYLR